MQKETHIDDKQSSNAVNRADLQYVAEAIFQ